MKEILTPCILQTIIICCTIIAITMIAVSAIRVWKAQKTHDSGTYIFITSSIVFMAITIFSYGFYQSSEILSFISLASSLISIILAVVTIIYSFYSNSRSSGQIDILNEAAQDVQKATTSYSNSAESLQENIQKIINAVNRVEEKTNLILDASKATKEGVGYNLANFANFDLDAYILGFINVASPLGIITLYACIKSNDKNKSLQLNIIGSNETVAYCGGFLIATTSAGLVTAYINFETWTVSTTNYIAPVKQHIDEWFDRNTSNQFIKDLKEKIDKYFESESK